MNLKHPYEKHLAEKLVQLPPPGDPDQNWQQMKVLLDKNMPRGGGTGPGGSYRWWIAGTVVVAVVVGTWFGGKQFLTTEKQRNEAVAGAIKTVNNKTAPSVASTDKKAEQQATPQPAPDGNQNDKITTTTGETTRPGATDPRGAAYASTSTTPNNNAPAVTNQNELVANNNGTTQNNNTVTDKNKVVTGNQQAAQHNAANNAANAEKPEKERSSTNNENNTGLLAGNDNNTAVPENNNYNNKTNSDRKKIYSTNKKPGGDKADNNRTNSRLNNRGRTNRNTGNRSSMQEVAAQPDAAAAHDVAKVKNGKRNKPAKKAAAVKPAADKEEENRYVYLPSISLPSQPTSGAGLMKGSPVAINVDYTGSAVVAPSGVLQREFTYYSQSDLFPDIARHTKRGSRKSSRSSEAQEDKKFAIGLSLPLAFPVGDQQALGYNRQAGVNTISDYIPSPHFQYHFNNKTYVQTGLQFASPQFIRPFLLYENEQAFRSGPSVYDQITSISARKLYYFNVPVLIYHSPLRNFYMGTGLQFSSLLSGVAYYEQVERRYSPLGPPQDYVIKNYFTKFQNDSLSNRLNRNEVRLLLDMSYYWSRFTVGLQYNQAFNNYVSFQVTPNSPYTFDKNKSLQFYLRYNIWEDKKRKQPKNQSMLTLK